MFPTAAHATPCVGAVTASRRAFVRPATRQAGRLRSLADIGGRGFTLLEVLVVVALIAIIAAIAYPSYIQHITRTARSDGMAALMDTAQIMERCYTQRNTYDDSDCHQRVDDYESPRNLYAVDLVQVDADSFTLEATPQGVQATRDGTRCSALRYDHTGTRTATGTLGDQCWN